MICIQASFFSCVTMLLVVCYCGAPSSHSVYQYQYTVNFQFKYLGLAIQLKSLSDVFTFYLMTIER